MSRDAAQQAQGEPQGHLVHYSSHLAPGRHMPVQASQHTSLAHGGGLAQSFATAAVTQMGPSTYQPLYASGFAASSGNAAAAGHYMARGRPDDAELSGGGGGAATTRWSNYQTTQQQQQQQQQAVALSGQPTRAVQWPSIAPHAPTAAAAMPSADAMPTGMLSMGGRPMMLRPGPHIHSEPAMSLDHQHSSATVHDSSAQPAKLLTSPSGRLIRVGTFAFRGGNESSPGYAPQPPIDQPPAQAGGPMSRRVTVAGVMSVHEEEQQQQGQQQQQQQQVQGEDAQLYITHPLQKQAPPLTVKRVSDSAVGAASAGQLQQKLFHFQAGFPALSPGATHQGQQQQPGTTQHSYGSPAAVTTNLSDWSYPAVSASTTAPASPFSAAASLPMPAPPQDASSGQTPAARMRKQPITSMHRQVQQQQHRQTTFYLSSQQQLLQQQQQQYMQQHQQLVQQQQQQAALLQRMQLKAEGSVNGLSSMGGAQQASEGVQGRDLGRSLSLPSAEAAAGMLRQASTPTTGVTAMPLPSGGPAQAPPAPLPPVVYVPAALSSVQTAWQRQQQQLQQIQQTLQALEQQQQHRHVQQPQQAVGSRAPSAAVGSVLAVRPLQLATAKYLAPVADTLANHSQRHSSSSGHLDPLPAYPTLAQQCDSSGALDALSGLSPQQQSSGLLDPIPGFSPGVTARRSGAGTPDPIVSQTQRVAAAKGEEVADSQRRLGPVRSARALAAKLSASEEVDVTLRAAGVSEEAPERTFAALVPARPLTRHSAHHLTFYDADAPDMTQAVPPRHNQQQQQQVGRVLPLQADILGAGLEADDSVPADDASEYEEQEAIKPADDRLLSWLDDAALRVKTRNAPRG